MLGYDDISDDDVWEVGEVSVDTEEMIRFAEKYDPQSFHVNPEEAEDSIFGGLVASGLQILCLFWRLAYDDVISNIKNLGGNTLDIEFHKPLRPNETLTGKIVVVEKQDSTSRDDRGYVFIQWVAETTEGKSVMTVESRLIIER